MSGEAVITGPVTGGDRGWVFGGTAVDLNAAGYVEEEFVLSGHARRYRRVPGTAYRFDGTWQAEEAGAAPYRTRVLVRRPRDTASFNGTILVGWTNVSAGYENVAELTPEVTENGFVQICVSAQRAGVHGFPFDEAKGLVTWDQARYGTLSVADDGLSYDVFTQAALASDRLAGLNGKRIAMGASQSAMRLATYVNAVQPLTNAFDAFMLDVYRGHPTVLDPFDPEPPRHDYGGPLTEIISGTDDPFQLRGDLPVPILVLNSESEASDYRPVRRPDTELYRFWEVAGAPHGGSDRWELAARRSARDFGAEGPAGFAIPENRSTISLDPVREAALHHVHRWVHGGPPPPVQPRLEFTGDPPRLARDEHGNAVGGIRLPDLEVPLATFVGERSHPIDYFGTATPFSAETVAALYGTHAAYLDRYDKAVSAAMDAGVVLPREAAELRARAAARRSGWPEPRGTRS